VRAGTPYDALLLALLVVAPLAGCCTAWNPVSLMTWPIGCSPICASRSSPSSTRWAPAYLLRRRSGDLVGLATQDVETIEYFYAHTVAPAVVAILVPGAVLVALAIAAWPVALALLPSCSTPRWCRARASPHRLARRPVARGARRPHAHVGDTIQGLSELVAFQATGRRRAGFMALVDDFHVIRLGFFRDLSAQAAQLEIATGLGGLAVAIVGALMVSAGRLERRCCRC